MISMFRYTGIQFCKLLNTNLPALCNYYKFIDNAYMKYLKHHHFLLLHSLHVLRRYRQTWGQILSDVFKLRPVHVTGL